MARGRRVRIDGERFGALHGRAERVAMGEHEARHAIGQRCLADALRAADQPGMRDPPALVGGKQRSLRLAVSEQHGSLARMGRRDLGLGLSRAHAVEATLAGAVKKRSRSAVQTAAATVLASPLASISTQRAGSAAAISR